MATTVRAVWIVDGDRPRDKPQIGCGCQRGINGRAAARIDIHGTGARAVVRVERRSICLDTSRVVVEHRPIERLGFGQVAILVWATCRASC